MSEPPTKSGVEADDVARRIALSMILFASITDTIHALLNEARDGDAAALGDILKKQGELETVLNRALAMESKLDELRTKAALNRRGGDLDTTTARDEIGRRLARIRNAAGTGGVL